MWEGGAGGNTYRNSESFVITFQFWAIIEEIRIICNINRNFLAKSLCLVNIFYFVQCLKPHAGDLAEHELGRHILFLICSGLLPPRSPAHTSWSLLAWGHDSDPSLSELHHQHPTPHPPCVTSSSHFPWGKHLMVCLGERESQFTIALLSFFFFFLALLLRMRDLNSHPEIKPMTPALEA